MFNVAAESYGHFMGRFSEPLADQFVGLVDARPGQRALDVGCGPGALTARLVDRLGPAAVAAVDPSESFVAAIRLRLPAVDVRQAGAEKLPFEDGSFDVCCAQLVVHFMSDPVAGLREMGRVARPGGVIAASVWDHAGGAGPLTPFWRAVQDLDPVARGESELAGAREGHLEQLCAEAGLSRVQGSRLTVSVGFATFEEWWSPYTLGVGPAGAHVARLDEAGREALRARCAEMLPAAPFHIEAAAWCVTARP
jgi:SAM-dependent methyltransferase